MTFSASAAVGEAFIVTAEYHENRGTSSATEYAYYSCGFGIALDPDDNNIKIGSITPQEIDGFKIIDMQDQGYAELNFETGDEDTYRSFRAEANRKCILHIKGKDYSLTTATAGGTFINAYNSDNIGIKDKEQIKVTYTLL
jgi:hypothetical protein